MTIRIPLLVMLAAAVPALSDPRPQAYGAPDPAAHGAYGEPTVAPHSAYAGPATASQGAYGGSRSAPHGASVEPASQGAHGASGAVPHSAYGEPAPQRAFGASGAVPHSAYGEPAPQRAFGAPHSTPRFSYHQVRFPSPARSYPRLYPVRHQAPAPGGYRQPCQTMSARMDILSGVSKEISGALFFFQECPDHPVQVTGKITGLSPGKHGLHVHGTPNLGNNCSDAGGHYNPFKANHGAQSDPIERRHVGDLGNIEADYSGVADINIQDSIISLFPGDRNIIRRAIVIHSGEDDLGRGGNEGSLKTGNAGKRLGCGVIAPNNPQH